MKITTTKRQNKQAKKSLKNSCLKAIMVSKIDIPNFKGKEGEIQMRIEEGN